MAVSIFNRSAVPVLVILATLSCLLVPQVRADGSLPKTVKLCGVRNDPTHLIAGYLARSLYARLNIRAHVNWTGRARSPALTDEGVCDGELVHPPDGLAGFPGIIQVKPAMLRDGVMAFGIGRQSNRLDALADLQGRIIGLPRHDHALKIVAAGLDIREYDDETETFTALLNKKVDLALTRQWSGHLVLRTTFANSGIQPHSRMLHPLPLYHLLHRTHQGLAQALAREIRKQRQGNADIEFLDDLLRRLARKSRS